MSAPQANDAEKNIEIWKVKKLIKRLEAARGNGTSMISLIIRMCYVFCASKFPSRASTADSLLFLAPKDQVSRAAKMLAEEFVSLKLQLRLQVSIANKEIGHRFQHQVAS